LTAVQNNAFLESAEYKLLVKRDAILMRTVLGREPVRRNQYAIWKRF